MVAVLIEESILNRVKLTAFLDLQHGAVLVFKPGLPGLLSHGLAISTVIARSENECKVKLVGALYDVSTGKVRFLYRF